MESKRLVQAAAIIFFVISLMWVFAAINVADLGASPQSSESSGTGVVKLTVISTAPQNGAVIKLNVLNEGG